jgi:hypothetical protein
MLSTRLYMRGSKTPTVTQIPSLVAKRRRTSSRKLLQWLRLIRPKLPLSNQHRPSLISNNLFLLKTGRISSIIQQLVVSKIRQTSNSSLFLRKIIRYREEFNNLRLRMYSHLSTTTGLILTSQEFKAIRLLKISSNSMLFLARRKGTARERSRMESLLLRKSTICPLKTSATILKTRLIKTLKVVQEVPLLLEELQLFKGTRVLLVK